MTREYEPLDSEHKTAIIITLIISLVFAFCIFCFSSCESKRQRLVSEEAKHKIEAGYEECVVKVKNYSPITVWRKKSGALVLQDKKEQEE